MLNNFLYLLADVRYKLFYGWYLTHGVWVDYLRIGFIILAGVVLIMSIAYWKSLRTTEQGFEGNARSWMTLGLCGLLSSSIYTQIIRLGYVITPALPLCILSIIVIMIGLLRSRVWRS